MRDRRKVEVALGAIAVAGIAEAVLIHLGRTYGSTPAERRYVLPGDGPRRLLHGAVGRSAAVPEQRAERGHDHPRPPAGRRSVTSFPTGRPTPSAASSSSRSKQSVRLYCTRRATCRRAGGRTHNSTGPGCSSSPRKAGGTKTRFLFRSRWRTAPWFLTAGARYAIVPADFVMARDMLHGVRARAELLKA
jgi:hypothetical protein